MTKIIFDTETTGLLCESINELSAQPYITEIYCLKIDDDNEVIGEFGTYIKPPIPIPDLLQKKIGITDEMVANAPTFEEVYPDLATFFLGADTMIAHNVGFDRSMVANELMRIEKVLHFPWPKKHICTVEATRGIEQRRISLTNLHIHLFEIGFPDAHSAKSDVLALHRCYTELVKRGYCE